MIYQKDCFPVLEKTHGVREVSHFLAYFDEFTTGLDGFKNSIVEFFLQASCVLILFSGRA